ncbi:thiamine diphosphate-binding protein [Earliella scabrosa]|nr:thiamine diphosphate-binding protein [Earliella scabrosa]
MYTTASVFFKTLADAGLTHAFVNWGSDHSAFLEDLSRQRAESGGKTLLEIVTCPSEYVALSAAHGYALVTGRPAAVIVHVDVGTQSLGGAIHNADRGQAPVLIFAGSSPFTANGELHASKNEFIMWLQDVPDQPAIVRQYMRYTAQIQSGKHASKMIMRALQFATSHPQGPVYLWARREVTDEEVDEATMNAPLRLNKWPSVTIPALSSHAVDTILSALLNAKFPLLLTSNSGRDPTTVPLLSTLSSTLGIGLLTVPGSIVCIPGSHPHFLGFTYSGTLPHLADADVIILLETSVPWVDTLNTPREDVKVFIIGDDPLKRTYGWSHVDADMLCTSDAHTALSQLLDALRSPAAQDVLARTSTLAQERKERFTALHTAWLAAQAAAETKLAPDGVLPTVPFVFGALREAARAQTPSGGRRVLWVNESVSNAGFAWNHIRPEVPGSFIMSGGSSLGWVFGAAVGASLGARVAAKEKEKEEREEKELVIAITGDGNFLFAMPTAAFWVARRYGTPFLTVVLNNRGWYSPKASLRGVHPNGYGSRASGQKLSIGFGHDNVDYGGVAAAAGGAWSRRVERAEELMGTLVEAIQVVRDEKRCAVVECILEAI